MQMLPVNNPVNEYNYFAMAVKEGILWKWTNYYNGWQPRWFVLRDGILSYFHSEDEVNVRCKGSIKLEACQVQCHSTDLTRFEVTAPRSCRLFLKAATARERQLWFLTLHGEAERNKAQSNSSTSGEQVTATRSRSVSIGSYSAPGEAIDGPFLHEAKCKRSEIRLYGEVLDAKLEILKQIVLANAGEPITEDRFTETVQLIAPTCSTLVATLEELAQLVEHAQARLGAAAMPSPSVSFIEPFGDQSVNVNVHVATTETETEAETSVVDKVTNGKSSKAKEKSRTVLRLAHDLLQSLASQDELSTETFLRLCAVLLNVMDSLHAAFANLEPAAHDLHENASLLQSAFDADRVRFASLDALLRASDNPTTQSALLWLKRSFEFVRLFLELVARDASHDVDGAVSKAYRAGLQVYHGSVLRDTFSRLTQAGLPDWSQIVQALASAEGAQIDRTLGAELDRLACSEIAELCPALRKLTDSLNNLLKRHNVDLNSMV